jgi:signal transduction histidine kinase
MPTPKTPKLITSLEWILIIAVAIAQLFAIGRLAENIIFVVIGMAIFSLLGLWRSSKRILNYLNVVTQCFIIAILSFWGKIYSYQLLFLVVVIRNCLILKRLEQYIFSALIVAVVFLIQTYRFNHQELAVQIVQGQGEVILIMLNLLFGLLTFALQLLIDKILIEEQNKQELAIANHKLRDYALRVEELAIVKERNRIAREIHDAMGHSLTVFNLYLEAALRLMPTDLEESQNLIKEAKQVGTKVLAEVRQAVTSLRSDPLEGVSLTEAINNLTNEFHRTTGVLPQTEVVLEVLPPQVLSNTIFRIVQESLTNICKHAEAKQVSISLVQSADVLNLTIADDGKGFDISKNTTGFGLQGMKERAIALSGELEIITAPQQGCKLQAKIPLGLL